MTYEDIYSEYLARYPIAALSELVGQVLCAANLELGMAQMDCERVADDYQDLGKELCVETERTEKAERRAEKLRTVMEWFRWNSGAEEVTAAERALAQDDAERGEP